jgi:hypothetical protein
LHEHSGIEKHTDGYVAYPLGLKGVVVGQGDTYDAGAYSITTIPSVCLNNNPTQIDP